MSHEHPLDEGETITCALCDEYASEDRDDFDWEQGPPICMYCMAQGDHEAIMNVGFMAAIDDIERKWETGDGATP